MNVHLDCRLHSLASLSIYFYSVGFYTFLGDLINITYILETFFPLTKCSSGWIGTQYVDRLISHSQRFVCLCLWFLEIKVCMITPGRSTKIFFWDFNFYVCECLPQCLCTMYRHCLWKPKVKVESHTCHLGMGGGVRKIRSAKSASTT